MITEITKGQLLALQLGRLKDKGRLKPHHVSMGKRNNVWVARECAKLAREILGANGIVDDYPVIRHMLNIESVYTYEGTHDIHGLVIGEAVTGIPAYNPPLIAEKKEKSRRPGRELMPLDRILEQDFIRVTEHAAIAAAHTMGRGDRKHSDHVAVEAMRTEMNPLDIAGRIVIGEGERDKAPMLYVGEEVGAGHGQEGSPAVDIAVDPLEGTNLCATGAPDAIAVLAAAERGGLLHAPDVYMEKLIVGPTARGRVHIDAPVAENLRNIAKAFEREVSDLTVVVLDRQRHEQLIADIRDAGARIRLIGDGDLSAGIAAAVRGTGVHAVMGTGGAPEGVLTAAAMRCLGGEIQAPPAGHQRRPARAPRGARHPRPDKIYTHRGPRAGRADPLLRHRRHRRRAAPGRALLRRRLPHDDALHVASPPHHPLRRHHPPRRFVRTGSVPVIKPDRWIRAWGESGGARPLRPEAGQRRELRRAGRRPLDLPDPRPGGVHRAARQALPGRGRARLDPRVRADPARRRLRPQAQVDARPAVDQPLARRLVRSRLRGQDHPRAAEPRARSPSCSRPAAASPS